MTRLDRSQQPPQRYYASINTPLLRTVVSKMNYELAGSEQSDRSESESDLNYDQYWIKITIQSASMRWNWENIKSDNDCHQGTYGYS